MSDNYPPGVTTKDFDDPETTDCPECDGEGKIEDSDTFDYKTYPDCSRCDGSGQVEIEKE